MIYALDVNYKDTTATVACIGFKNWNDKTISYKKTYFIDGIAPYQSGEFYKRELPCLIEALEGLDDIECVVVDGFVWLGKSTHYGLGGYLYEVLNLPVIGVAKNRFSSTPKECEIFRGKSKKPLYITSIGIDLESAKEHILNMYGEYRLPFLLKEVDRICRIPKI